MIFWLLIVTAAFLFYKWATSNYDYFEKRGIKFLEPKFLLGSNTNMFINKRSYPEIVQKWYNDSEMKSEKVIGLFSFRQPEYFIRDPKLAKKLAVKDFDFFTDHRVIFEENTDTLIENALINLRGQKWRDMRTTLSPAFTGSKMRQMYQYVAKVGQQSSETIKQQIKAKGDNVFEFKELATRFTVDVIATSAFGIEVNSFKDPENDFYKISKTVTNFANFKTIVKFFGFLTVPRLMKFFKITFFDKDVKVFFDEAVHEMMRVREEKGVVRHDMINLLMQAKKGQLKNELKEEENTTEGFATVKESQTGQKQVKTKLDDDDIASQAFIFFAAGFETVSTTMGFLGYELTVNPEAQEKLYQEILEMEAELDGKTINYEQIQGMKYMDQVVCETLRKWPAVPLTDRSCVKDYSFDYEGQQFVIEKGRILMIPIQGYHHDSKFFPEPDKFIPERFSEVNRGKIDPDTYLPFGIGPRNCIGSRFALMEVKTIFYYLLLNFSFEISEKTQIPLKLLKSPVVVKAEKGIWVQLKPRTLTAAP